jgi:hypothetical protein
MRETVRGLKRARGHHRAVHLAMRRHERRWQRADFEREPWTSIAYLRRPDLEPAATRVRR